MENACDLYLAKTPALIYNSAVMCASLVGSVLLSGGNGSDNSEGASLASCAIGEREATALPAKSSCWDGQETTKKTPLRWKMISYVSSHSLCVNFEVQRHKFCWKRRD